MARLDTLTDNELFDLLKSGERGVFAEIYKRYKFILHNHAYKKIGNREEAKDVVQDVFTNLWLKREIIKVHTNLSGYLYTSLKNSILNLFAHQHVREKYVASMEIFSGMGAIETDGEIREKQLSELIEIEIFALPSKMRNVFELSRKSYLSHKEIAGQLNISEKTVDRHISNALKILRTKLNMLFFLIFLFKL